MLFILNPPYGRASKISRRVVNYLLENIKLSQLVCIAPKKSNYDHFIDLKNIVGPYSLSSLFDITESNDMDLYISYYTEFSKGTFSKSLAEAFLNSTQWEYYKAVQVYNKKVPSRYTFLKELTVKMKEVYKKYPENLIFEIPLFTPANGIQLGGQTGSHNLQGKPIEYRHDNTAAPYALYFNSLQSFNNFSHWYYAKPYSWSRSRKKIENIMDLSLSILFTVYGAGPSILKYVEVWPNLDWNKQWTDEEIIQELKDKAGLPQNWSLSN